MINWVKTEPSNKWYAEGVTFCVVSLECESARFPAYYYLVHAIDGDGWIIDTNAPVSRHRSANAAFRAVEKIVA